MEPFPKRSRSQFDGSGLSAGFPDQPPPPPVPEWEAVQQGNSAGGGFRHVSSGGKDVGHQTFSSGGKPKPCMKFFSTSGCPFGESCHFLHYVPGGLSSMGLTPVVSMPSAPTFTSQRKPVVPAGDPSTIINGYKTKLCNRFKTAEGCRFGDQCHFAHGENDLRPPNNLSRGTAPGFNDGGPNFSNPGYMIPPRDVSNFSSQGYGESNPPGNTDVSSSYHAGPVSENVKVF